MFSTLAFWCVCAALFAAAHLIPTTWLRLRSGCLAAISLVGILLVLELTPTAICLALGSIAWVLGVLMVVKPNPRGATTRAAVLMIAPIVAIWATGKIAVANNHWLGLLFFVGSSFLLVKAFSLIKDRLEGKALGYDPVVGAAYFLYFPTFLAGPMHTYDEFHNTLVAPVQPRGEMVPIVFRFVWGLFKVSVLAAALDPLSLTALTKVDTIPVGELIFGAFAYSGVLYFNFSGYSDMVISISRAMGIHTPENFHLPYLSPSIRDFWRRWHITFSRALTAHVFMPLSRTLSRVLPKNRFVTPAIGYFATFVFAGFWHGSTVNFLLWGAWHALGLVVQDFYQKLRPRKIGAPAKPSLLGQSVRIAATFVFVSVGWIFFVLPVEQLGRIR